MAREQLNLRLPPEWFDTLNAEAQILGLTVAEYVRSVVSDRVGELEDDLDVQAVQAVLRAARSRRSEGGESQGNVTRLRRTSGGEG
jgi:predicted DNA-binding protein